MSNTAKQAVKETETEEVTKSDAESKVIQTPKIDESGDTISQVTKVEETALETVQPAQIDEKTGQLILTPKHKELIKTQIAKNATKEELDLFLMMAYRTRLDPLMKQLYFIKYGNNVSYVTSIDGYRIIAHRTGDFAGIDEPEYKYDPSGKLTHCTVRVYRKSSVRAFAATVKFTEYNTGKNMWASMPETMIAKVAEAHALRKAFPQDLSGIYTTDEMDQAKKETQPPVIKMITKDQVKKINELIKSKEFPVDKLKVLVKEGYKRESIADFTYKQADHLIGKLKTLPDPVVEEIEDASEVVEIPEDESFADFVTSEMSKKEPLPDDVDLDEIDKAISGIE